MRKKSMRFISAALAACMMASTLPVGAFALEGDTAPESGVSTQAEETTENTVTPTPIPTAGYTIEKGGDYELKEDTYTGGIIVNVGDDEEVTIHIASNVKFTRDNQVFIWVENAKLVTIENTDNHTVTLNGQHFFDLKNSSNGVVNGGTYIAPGRNMIMLLGTDNTLTLNNVNIRTTTGYAVTAEGGGQTVVVNGGTFTKSTSAYSEFKNCGHLTLNNVTVIPEVAEDGKTSTIVENYTGAVLEINGGNYKTVNQPCITNTGTVTINEGTATDTTFETTGASCINNRSFVEINGGTFTSDAASTIYNRGILRMTGGAVINTNEKGAALDLSGNYGDIQLSGGTIKGNYDGIYAHDLGSSEVILKQVTFDEGNQNDIHLGEGQKINIKKTFTGKAKILVDDADIGRQITLENDDTRYQKDLNLVSNNEGYIVGYKREDGVEYRYLAAADGHTVSATDAKATADLGAGAQQLDTTDVVPENTTVTVTADIPAEAEFLDWSVLADGQPLAYTPAEDDPQTITFTMPGCNVTVAALYQNNTPGLVNPGGGDDPVTEFFEAAAVTGVAAWGLYETATGIYRVLNMRGIPMPSNRAGLATLIWEKAGQPEPQTLKTYSDVDESDIYLRKAASWMEEQGLMEARDDGSFKPYGYVTKLRTCFVWDMARDGGLVG